jgi:hypothetical protein
MNYSSGSVSVFFLVPRTRSVDRRAPATRGPSTVPDDWTEVFGAAATTGSGVGTTDVTGFAFFLIAIGCHGEKKGEMERNM